MNVSDYNFDEDERQHTYIPTGESLKHIRPLYREEPTSAEFRLLSADGSTMNTCVLYSDVFLPFVNYNSMGVSEEDKEIIHKRDYDGNYLKFLYNKYGQWIVVLSTNIPWKEYPNPDVPMQKYVDFFSAQVAHIYASDPNHMSYEWATEIHFTPKELPRDQWRYWVLNEAKTQYLRK